MKSTYIMVVELRQDSRIKIGALGEGFFRKGIYAYAGSAMGGLEHRIRRHLGK